jgi:hypothetical protein
MKKKCLFAIFALLISGMIFAQSDNQADYFVTVGEDQYGPYAFADMEQMIQSGHIIAESWVWRDGMAGWEAAIAVPELTPFFPEGAAKPHVENDPNLGEYPGHYPIAYFSNLGYSNAPTVRDLFGVNAKFATTLDTFPSVISIEETAGTIEKFTGRLLLTVKNPTKGDVRTMRLSLTFVSDENTGTSICRHIRFTIILGRKTIEYTSTGEPHSDARVAGILVDVLKYFWDIPEG